MKPPSYSIRIPVELMEKIRAKAQEEGRSVANMIIHLLTLSLIKKKGKE